MAPAAALARAEAPRARVGLVDSAHKRLGQPVSIEHPLDYPRVREMVWRAIEYGRPRAGSLEAKIPAGCWVVIKPNIGHLRGRPAFRAGDVTDLRVTRAVLEYVARKSRAGRVTVAEGGTYRNLTDPASDNVAYQNGVRVNAVTCDWGEEFPGMAGTLGGLLDEFRKEFPGKRFDYVDLSYDAVRDAAGGFRRIEVPRTAGGVGACGGRPDYYVTNTIRNCDFLINVPVMKIHLQCGITACFKNYVGTAPRQVYAPPGSFSNTNLHREHSVEGRIEPFFVDLAAFHPPDFNVVDGIRGLQFQEHNNRRPDQMLQNNLVLAGEDTVATDTMVAQVMGFNPWDMEYLHLGAERGLGTMDPGQIEVIGEEPDRVRKRWGKPRDWLGRANREWLVSRDAEAPLASWTRHKTRADTLHFTKWNNAASPPGTTYGAAVRVRAEGSQKAFLWAGVRGHLTALLNGEKVMEEENLTRYRIGQFRNPVELRAGDNLLVFRVQQVSEEAQLSALLVGPRNDGDTPEGIRWMV